MIRGPTLRKPNSRKNPEVCGIVRKPQIILGDRMVPPRCTTDFEAAHYKIN